MFRKPADTEERDAFQSLPYLVLSAARRTAIEGAEPAASRTIEGVDLVT